MATTAFVADNTIPGLGASDLVRRAAGRLSGGLGDTLGGVGRLRAELAAFHREMQLRRDLGGLDVHTLGDIGLDRSRQ